MAKVEIPERVLAQVWKRQLVDATKLVTSSGDALRVIYPGKENRDRGPDFVGAVLTASGKGVLKGDVEIHSRAGDWKSHGHSRDKHYNGVILQVVWEGEDEAVLNSGRRIPTLSLRSCLEGSLDDVHCRLQVPAMPGEPCHNAGECLGDNEIGKLLDKAGDERFQHKAEAFKAVFDRGSPRQALYAGIMAALGYSKNKQPFEDLAYSLPVGVLEEICRGKPVSEQVSMLKALLLGRAGFLDGSADTGLKTVWQRLGDGRPMSPESWSTFRVRPENHPARRLEGAAYMLSRFMNAGLLEGIILSVAESHGDVRQLESIFTVSAPGTCPDDKRVLIGQGRAREIAINVVLPFVLAWAEASSQVELAGNAWALYRSCPRAGEYGVTRELAGLLAGNRASGIANSARRQQGLLHLDHTFCRPRECERCPVALRLKSRRPAG